MRSGGLERIRLTALLTTAMAAGGFLPLAILALGTAHAMRPDLAGDPGHLAASAALGRHATWALVALAAGGAVVLAVASRVARLMTSLAEGAEAIARGQAAAPAPAHGPREVARLARAFGEMAQALERRERRLRDSEAQAHRAVEQLQASLGDKEVLLKEIHHRVKNNLQVVSSLLALGVRHLDEPVARATFADTQERIRAMALVHEQLYRSPDHGRADLGAYLEALARHLARSYAAPHVRVTVQSDAIPLPLDVAMPCGLIATELIANALKHAFPDGRAGTVRVAGRAGADRTLVLTVADDGIGLSPDVDPSDAPTLGLSLVRSLAEQLDAPVGVTRVGGTTFTLRVHLPPNPAGGGAA